MKYIIIEQSNFDDIERIQKEAKVRVETSYKLDQFDNYEQGTFAVLGKQAVQMFCNKYGYTFAGQETMKTDGRTSAEIVPLLTPSYYYDARSKEGGMIEIYSNDKIGFLVKFGGVLLWHYKKNYNSDMRGFLLFNDDTDYNTYLPYGWEEEHPRPNYIGTITDKKIRDWVDWLLARKAAADAARDKANNKVAAFLEKVRSFDVTGCTKHQVTDTRGFFVRNGIKYSYEISSGGHIAEKVEVDYTFSMAHGETLDKYKLMVSGSFR